MLNVAGVSILEIPEVALGDYPLLDEGEFEEELFTGTIIGISIEDLFITKSRLMSLDFQTACLSPDSPPPKHI
jgi:hypothetical protein